jgi:hypothetical protein
MKIYLKFIRQSKEEEKWSENLKGIIMNKVS